jgi:CDP-paratose 2-epimerase
MSSRVALVAGSSGLIGSEAVAFLDARGWRVHGVDNNVRADFFGAHGDTTWNLERLRGATKRFEHHALDVRDRAAMDELVCRERPELIVHAAAQPSHDLAASRPFDDFAVNAVGTLNLLEAARWDYADPTFAEGIDETMRIDGTMHSLFGASKAAVTACR